MNTSLWAALGLVILIEGIGPFLFPQGWRQMVSQLAEQPDNHLRRVGGCLVVAGAVMLWMFT